ncbi:MAG: hypothetical protein MUE96_08720 [Bacteroidia bacterium]|nr:hypothetical protein [Bacteroidia bacterium]
MKNINGFMVIGLMAVLTSCITAAQFNNADDDVYYSPKKQNAKNPVMIPEVDVDEIIRKNPPQYGSPLNRIDIEQVTPNPNAAAGYVIWKKQQDSLYALYPERSAYYVDPNLPNSETDEAARRERMRARNWFDGNWNWGIGWNAWGPSFYAGYQPYSNWGWNTGWGCNQGWNVGLGWNAGWGYNSWMNPYIGWNTGWGYNPWWGATNYCFPPAGSSNETPMANQPISMPRGRTSYAAPINQPNTAPTPPAYTPSRPAPSLNYANGRTIYRAPASMVSPALPASPAITPEQQIRPSMRTPVGTPSTPNYAAPQRTSTPSYNRPSGSTPSTGRRR